MCVCEGGGNPRGDDFALISRTKCNQSPQMPHSLWVLLWWRWWRRRLGCHNPLISWSILTGSQRTEARSYFYVLTIVGGGGGSSSSSWRRRSSYQDSKINAFVAYAPLYMCMCVCVFLFVWKRAGQTFTFMRLFLLLFRSLVSYWLANERDRDGVCFQTCVCAW